MAQDWYLVKLQAILVQTFKAGNQLKHAFYSFIKCPGLFKDLVVYLLEFYIQAGTIK